MTDAGSKPGEADAGQDAPTVKDFLKKHVRGIPRDQMKRKVLYGFRYRDLKEFISEIISRHAGASSAELLAKISDLEIRLRSERQSRESVEAQGEASAMRISELEAAGQASASASGELEKAAAEKKALEDEIAALKSAAAAGESAAAAAAEEAGNLKVELEALEKEAEFLDAEMEKLNARNKQLEEGSAALLRELEAEKERGAKDKAEAADRIAVLQGVVEKSKDMQKVLALEDEMKRLRKAIEAWEAAGEFMAAERVPDFESADALARSAIEKIASGKGAACADDMAAALEGARAELENGRKSFQVLLDAMNAWKGDFETIYSLGKAAGMGRGLEARIGVLKGIAEKLGRS